VEGKPGIKLVSISLKLPYCGIDNAGGELVLQHYRVLAARCARIDAFANEADDNVIAVSRNMDINCDSYSAEIIDRPRWRESIFGQVVARLWFMVFPVLPDIADCISFATSKSLRARVLEADIVELQWFEFFYFAWLVKRISPHVEIIGFAHDIPNAVRRVSLSYVAWLERQMLSRIQKVTVLSAKDAALVAARSNSVEVFVLNPPLDLRSMESKSGQVKNSDCGGDPDTCFGFVGALHRPENNDAALWLLSDIWPHVRATCPGAKLYIVGAKPSGELHDAANKFGDSVTVTGYVDDIDSFYDLFSTVVIPLRYGAGVKFKTISGILAEKNIVATPTAIEGTLPAEYFFSVSDSAATLARAMVELATSPAFPHELPAKARAEVGSRYSLVNYAQTVADVYRL
jgi:glycosyltransferase involved in cell wall biosynthesis